MSLTTKKICLVGDFGVGKTSIVARAVHQRFSDKYLTTVGVSIKTKLVECEGEAPVKFVIWDIAGGDAVSSSGERYLRGADAYLLVVDGTRQITAQAAQNLRVDVAKICGDIPYICLFNKDDLAASWEVSQAAQESLSSGAFASYRTSAKDGTNVELAFQGLVRALSA